MFRLIILIAAIIILGSGCLKSQEPLGEIIWQKDFQSGSIGDIKFSNTDVYISAKTATNVMIINPVTSDLVCRLPYGKKPCFTPDDRFVWQANGEFLKGGTIVYKYEIPSLKIVDSLQMDDREVWEIKLFDEGRKIVGHVDRGLRIWDAESGEILLTREAPWYSNTHFTTYSNIQELCDGSLFMHYERKDSIGVDPRSTWTVYHTYGAYVWIDPFTLDSFRQMPNSRESFISPDCQLIVGMPDAGSSTNGVVVYDAVSGDQITRLPVNSLGVREVGFDKQSHFVITAGGGVNAWARDKTWKSTYLTGGSVQSFDVTNDNLKLVKVISDIVFVVDVQIELSSNEEAQGQLSVFPNPTEGATTININEPGIYDINIYSMSGGLPVKQMGKQNVSISISPVTGS